MRKYLDDILIFIGCGFILVATCQLSPIAALFFVAGFMFIVFGFLVGIGNWRNKC